MVRPDTEFLLRCEAKAWVGKGLKLTAPEDLDEPEDGDEPLPETVGDLLIEAADEIDARRRCEVSTAQSLRRVADRAERAEKERDRLRVVIVEAAQMEVEEIGYSRLYDLLRAALSREEETDEHQGD